MDVAELRELLSPEGLRLLDEVGPIDSTADVVRIVSRLREDGHSGGLVAAVLGQARLRAKAVPKVPEWERIVTEMQIVAERMVRGEYTPETAAAEIDRRADRLLEKRRWMMEQGRVV